MFTGMELKFLSQVCLQNLSQVLACGEVLPYQKIEHVQNRFKTSNKTQLVMRKDIMSN